MPTPKTSGDWTFYVCDQFGGPFEVVTGNVKLTYRRNGYPEAVVTLDGEGPGAIATSVLWATSPTNYASAVPGPAAWSVNANGVPTPIAGGTPLLLGWRDGVCRFAGMLAAFEDAGDDGGVTATATYRGPYAFAAEATITSGTSVLTGKTYPEVVKVLVSGWSGLALSSRFSSYTHTAGSSGEVTLTPGQTIGEIIQSITDGGGADFEVTPAWPLGEGGTGTPPGRPSLGTFYAAPSIGSDKTATCRFEYGPTTLGNVRSVRRVMIPPQTIVQGLGANGLESIQGLYTTPVSAFGEYFGVLNRAEVTGSTTLAALAAAAIRDRARSAVEVTPDPDLSPQPWTDYWLGDTVAVKSRRGSLVFDRSARVNGIGVTVDENGVESEHTLTFDQEV